MTRPTIRKYTPRDLPALLRLVNESDCVDNAGFATTEEALAHHLSALRSAPTDAIYLAEKDGLPVGWAAVYLRQCAGYDRFGTTGIVHPDHRRHGVGTALMQRIEEHARPKQQRRPTFLEIYARQRVTGTDRLALSLGYRPARNFLYMHCRDLRHLPQPGFPAGVRLRHYVPREDEAAFLEAYNDAFSDHFAHAPHTAERERQRVSEPGFRAEDNLLAIDEQERIAGICLLRFPQMAKALWDQNPPLIDDLAVTHRWRRRGLGRALLLAGMHRIRQLGFTAVALAVDLDNPNQALRLYESVGFSVQSRTTLYRKELEA